MKGWGGNLRGDFRKKKEEVLHGIKAIDALDQKNGGSGLDEQERVGLETELENILEEEETYWQQRGSEKQVLEGDANTSFFHMSANGKRRKKSILSLEHNGGNITDQKQIRGVIEGFYKKLFGQQPRSTVTLAEGAWSSGGKLEAADNDLLTKPFTKEEVKKAIFDMKENSAPGLDGFSVTFYKHCW